MLVEREEGLFTRHGATRTLCVVASIAWAILCIAVLALVLNLSGAAQTESPTPGSSRLFGIIVIALVALLGALNVLWLWRRCDRCRKRLFADDKVSTPAGSQSGAQVSWLPKIAERDYRAKMFLGSYRSAAILDLALKGRLQCQWCGHEDGVDPDYVVTSSSE